MVSAKKIEKHKKSKKKVHLTFCPSLALLNQTLFLACKRHRAPWNAQAGNNKSTMTANNKSTMS
eukprot:6088771-Amphidinium_carterae.1